MKRVYFFQNLSSSSTNIIPQANSTTGTVASFSVPYSTGSFPCFGFVVTGNIQTCTVNLQIYDGLNWTIINSYQKSDLTYTDGTTSITQTLSGGMFYNTQHRLTISNPNGVSLSGISAYFILDDSTTIYSGDYTLNMSFSALPYSVSSASVDANGLPNFISKTDNSTVRFNTSVPVVCCYPDGTSENNSTIQSITNITSDGIYYIVKEKGSNPYVTTLQIFEQAVPPTSPAANQLWLNTSVKPLIPNKWNGSVWIPTQFVKLGEFIKTGGIIGTILNYALNGSYISGLYPLNTTFAGSTSLLIQHNLGKPANYNTSWNFVCINAENGYLPGDEISQYNLLLTNGMQWATDTNSNNSSTIARDSSLLLIVHPKSGGSYTSINAANWALKFSGYRKF